jgi:hypothetical protein
VPGAPVTGAACCPVEFWAAVRMALGSVGMLVGHFIERMRRRLNERSLRAAFVVARIRASFCLLHIAYGRNHSSSVGMLRPLSKTGDVGRTSICFRTWLLSFCVRFCSPCFWSLRVQVTGCSSLCLSVGGCLENFWKCGEINGIYAPSK